MGKFIEDDIRSAFTQLPDLDITSSEKGSSGNGIK